MVQGCWLVLRELFLQSLLTSRGPDGGLRVAPSHGSLRRGDRAYGSGAGRPGTARCNGAACSGYRSRWASCGRTDEAAAAPRRPIDVSSVGRRLQQLREQGPTQWPAQQQGGAHGGGGSTVFQRAVARAAAADVQRVAAAVPAGEHGACSPICRAFNGQVRNALRDLRDVSRGSAPMASSASTPLRPSSSSRRAAADRPQSCGCSASA